MKIQFLYGIIGVLLLSVPFVTRACPKELGLDPKVMQIKNSVYNVIKTHPLELYPCGCVDTALLTIEAPVIRGLVAKQAFNVPAAAGYEDPEVYILSDKNFKLVFRTAPTNAAVMAAIVGVYAYQHRDEVAQVAKNAALATKKAATAIGGLAKNAHSSAKAFIKSKL